jgi:chemotaxis protein methyltransferase WspC
MNAVEHFLQASIGLEIASVGAPLVQRATRSRMKHLGITSLLDYLLVLRRSKAEAQELIESVVVPETWFFRDPSVFDMLGRIAAQGRLSGKAGDAPFRLLSVPCSSGEEPFSMAIALLSAGIPRHRFRIDAVDISARALTHAGKAVYGRNSFRSKDLRFRDRFFRPTAAGFTLNPEVRACVSFYQGNLVAEGFPCPPGQYNCVFCRNLLIYLDRLAQQQALEKLEGLLVPRGLLFVGATEQPIVARHGFVSARLPQAFAFRRAVEPATPRARPAGAPNRPPGVTLPADLRRPRPHSKPGWNGNEREGLASLDAARKLADAGRLEEAAAICLAHLRREKTAAAYYLLGLVRDAAGDPAAAECYRRAVYLQPDHAEALLQMAFLYEREGKLHRARAFRRRARRTNL